MEINGSLTFLIEGKYSEDFRLVIDFPCFKDYILISNGSTQDYDYSDLHGFKEMILENATDDYGGILGELSDSEWEELFDYEYLNISIIYTISGIIDNKVDSIKNSNNGLKSFI